MDQADGRARILVAGAGAIGGYIAAHLARAGASVVALDAWPDNVSAIQKSGIRIEGLTSGESFSAKVRTLHIGDVAGLAAEPAFDVVLLAVKSYDTPWMARLVEPLLCKRGCMVSVQNGINESEMARVVGWKRTLGCVVARVSAELVEPGFVRRTTALGGTDYVSFRIGEPHGIRTGRAEKVAALLRTADSAAVTTNLWGERWSKLVVNAMRNGLSAATGLSGNERDLDPSARLVSIMLAAEGALVGRALDYPLTDLAGLSPGDVCAAAAGDAACLARVSEQLERGARARSDRQRPSMAQDIARGRRTETHAINGFVAELGREVGVPTPFNEAVHDAVLKIEAGLARPNPALVRSWTATLATSAGGRTADMSLPSWSAPS